MQCGERQARFGIARGSNAGWQAGPYSLPALRRFADQCQTPAIRIKRHDHDLTSAEYQCRVQSHARRYRGFGTTRVLFSLALRSAGKDASVGRFGFHSPERGGIVVGLLAPRECHQHVMPARRYLDVTEQVDRPVMA
jgi:hypothetical protein